MAITSAAKKYIKVSKKRYVFNLRRRRDMRSSIKNLIKLCQNKQPTEVAYIAAQKAIDKAVKSGIIKQNTGARKKSRIVKLITKK